MSEDCNERYAKTKMTYKDEIDEVTAVITITRLREYLKRLESSKTPDHESDCRIEKLLEGK